jgi:DNA mismatch endonuclease (patch repair protein)
MADIVPPDVRSRMMAAVRGKDTLPEMTLRRGLHRAGFRFRLHANNLPGRPDMVFPKYRAALFVHGCFWHGHDCHLFRLPATRRDFWAGKVERNRANDARSSQLLAAERWRVGVVWECALKGRARLPLPLVLDSCARWLRTEAAWLDLRGNP